MSDRLKKIFSEKEPKTKLISYFVGCYPDYDQSLSLMKEAIDNGVSILEIGYCTSEASAEGPIIKKAHDCFCEERTRRKAIRAVALIESPTQTKAFPWSSLPAPRLL